MELEPPIDSLIFNKLDIFYKKLIKRFIKEEIKNKLSEQLRVAPFENG